MHSAWSSVLMLCGECCRQLGTKLRLGTGARFAARCTCAYVRGDESHSLESLSDH